MSAAANRVPALERERAHHNELQAEVRRILGRLASEGFSPKLMADARASYRNVWQRHYAVFPRP
jgi:hypothetical protein